MAGELVANLVLLRNINPITQRFELKELNVVTDKPPTDFVKVSCVLDAHAFSRLRIGLGEKTETTLVLKTELTNPSGALVAQVRSVWFVQRR